MSLPTTALEPESPILQALVRQQMGKMGFGRVRKEAGGCGKNSSLSLLRAPTDRIFGVLIFGHRAQRKKCIETVDGDRGIFQGFAIT